MGEGSSKTLSTNAPALNKFGAYVRRSPRVALNLTVTLPGGRVCITQNISEDGVAIMTAERWATNAAVEMTLHDGTSSVSLQAKVVHCSGRIVGFRFLDLTPPAKLWVERVVSGGA